MNFSIAMEHALSGHKVCRTDWKKAYEESYLVLKAPEERPSAEPVLHTMPLDLPYVFGISDLRADWTLYKEEEEEEEEEELSFKEALELLFEKRVAIYCISSTWREAINYLFLDSEYDAICCELENGEMRGYQISLKDWEKKWKVTVK